MPAPLSPPIVGTNYPGLLIGDFAAAGAPWQSNTLFDSQAWEWHTDYWHWNRQVHALGGDDLVMRDRPGDYSPDTHDFPDSF